MALVVPLFAAPRCHLLIVVTCQCHWHATAIAKDHMQSLVPGHKCQQDALLMLAFIPWVAVKCAHVSAAGIEDKSRMLLGTLLTLGPAAGCLQ